MPIAEAAAADIADLAPHRVLVELWLALAAGHSLERVPAGKDTDTAGDWFDQPAPSPGAVAGQSATGFKGSATRQNAANHGETIATTRRTGKDFTAGSVPDPPPPAKREVSDEVGENVPCPATGGPDHPHFPSNP